MSSSDPQKVPLAPCWHTGALIAVIVAVAATGALLTSRGLAPSPPAPAGSRVLISYVPMLLVQGGLVAYVSRVGRPRSVLRALLGAGWNSLGRAAADLAIALAGWALLLACEFAWARLFATGTPASVTSLLPHTLSERLAWLVVSLCVGCSEEIVFRGYLQTQLTAFTKRPLLALLLQGALFGLAHAEQGAGAVLRLALYGVAFGALARWRKSLLPGMACHAWTDLASGLLRP